MHLWILKPDVTDFRVDTDKYGPFSNRATKIFRPKIISRRISSQTGLFTAHKINEGGKIVKLERHRRFSKKLITDVPIYLLSLI